MASAIRTAANWQSRKKSPSRIVRAVFHQSESLRQRHLKVYPDRPAAACHRGCDYCCRGTKVDVSVPETLAIIDHQREHLSALEFANFSAKVDTEAVRVRGFDLRERAVDRAPCVLLNVATSECSVYAVRPLACRHHHSLDADPCRRNYEDSAGDHFATIDPLMHRDGQLSQFALQYALVGLGLDAAAYELTNALAVALRDATAAARWQKGQVAFEEARLMSDEADRQWVDDFGNPIDSP